MTKDTYNVSGEILIEGTGESARYDFEMVSDQVPSEMDVLNYMMETGIIQILHEETILVTDEEE